MERMKRILAIKAVLVLACFSFPSITLANVQEVSGLSSKATAMGNAFSAVADDFSAVYYNPAGLAQQDHHSLYMGYLVVLPRLKQFLMSDTEDMNTFEKQIEIRWSDVDQNRHVRHSVYYDFGTYLRTCFLAEFGYDAETMNELNMGKILFKEECTII